ncbi:MAG: energy transducer TonB, partial [Bacteroidales bacterium]|nr:energy transducer TonB [Bacteroidales bacterium]
MEAKKSDKANLEKTKTMYTLLGLVIALSIVILAFEWKTYDKEAEDVQLTTVVQEVEEMIIQTRQEEPPPPPEEPQQAETTEFEIVDDDQELQNEFSIETFENTGNADV